MLVAALLLTAQGADASIIQGLYNTGVDNGGNALSAGIVDPHYELLSSDDVNYPAPSSLVTSSLPANWLANSAVSQWISPNEYQASVPINTPIGNAAGTYIFRLTFDLTGFDPAQTSIAGQWAADDVGLIYLNSVFVPGTMNLFGPSTMTAFSIPTGSNFVSGVNYLDFVVVNDGAGNVPASATGVQVQQILGSTVPIPEPAAWLLAAFGAGGVLLVRRFARRNA